MRAAMFVVFEGIDGSGKTTISNRVAEELRRRGTGVAHVREGGKFASRVTQAIRELGRDARNLNLVPRAELLLFLARDVQLLEEATIPALEDHDVVLADRFFYTAEVLARHGRGLALDDVLPAIRSVSRGFTPDLVILVDVDPHVARARRRVAKIITPDPRPSSRKGLSGVGLQHRLREGYRELAARDPARWLVLDNTDSSLDEAVATALRWIEERRGTPAGAEAPPAPTSNALGGTATYASGDAAVASFLAWIDRRAEREPATAAYFLAGLAGPGVDERREALAAHAPELVAHALRGLTDAVSWRLRHALAARAPSLVARSLAASAGEGDDAWRLREALADVVPSDVAASLDGRDEDRAWTLRERLYAAAPDGVVASLKRISSARAWALRERWLAEQGGEASLARYELARTLCESVNGVDDERAWRARRTAREEAPIAAIGSLGGLTSDLAWKWRRRALDRAPKAVLRTISGIDDPRAWELREACATRVKEAIDSMLGLDGDRAWALRDSCVDIWPSTVVKSLGTLARTPRGQALVERQLARHPGNISLLKHVTAIALGVDIALAAEAE